MVHIGLLSTTPCAGKTVLLRLDLNSPIDPSSLTILDDKRFREHVPTVQALRESRLITRAGRARKTSPRSKLTPRNLSSWSNARSGTSMIFSVTVHARRYGHQNPGMC